MIISSPKAVKYITKIGEVIHSPHQRLLLGISALASQPFIDWNNKKADKKTRAVSTARTVSKIAAGTLTGVLVRAGSIKAIDYFSKAEHQKTSEGFLKIIPKTIKDIFAPKTIEIKEYLSKTDFDRRYKHYTNALGTLIAAAVMIFTNFLIDVPLTKYFTGKLTPKLQNLADKKEAGGVK